MGSKININTIFEELKSIALNDNIISEEENSLITAIISNLKEYTKLLNKALKDKKIDNKEKDELFEARMKIMEHAYKAARSDAKISSDEAALLQHICKTVVSLSDYESNFFE